MPCGPAPAKRSARIANSGASGCRTSLQTTSAAPTHALVEDAKGEATHATAKKLARVPSFGHGTPVWTLAGLRPIESVRAGDKVLTQDVSSGALNFAPVLAIHHLSRDPVKSITFGDASIVATTLERFWVPGRGWVRVFELNPGDVIRLLGTVARLDAVEAAVRGRSLRLRFAPVSGSSSVNAEFWRTTAGWRHRSLPRSMRSPIPWRRSAGR